MFPNTLCYIYITGQIFFSQVIFEKNILYPILNRAAVIWGGGEVKIATKKRAKRALDTGDMCRSRRIPSKPGAIS